MKFRCRIGASLLFACTGLLPVAGSAAGYPDRPIVFVAPFAPGSTTDGAARVLAQHMARTLGQPAVVENKVGAGGTIGLTAGARSKADGYTLIFTGMSAHVIASFTMAGLSWDPVASFTPVGQIATVPLAMAVTSALPVADLREFVAYAKARPDELTYATLGPTTAQSLAMQMFMQRTGIKLREVPYKSSSQILTDLAAGRVDMTIDNVANVLPAVRGGRVRPLAVSTGKRMDVMPDVPTISESVAPGFQVASWVGLVAPAGVPPDTVGIISSALLKALDSVEYKQWLHNNGAQPPEHPESRQFGKFIEDELKLWRSAADLAGVPAVK